LKHWQSADLPTEHSNILPVSFPQTSPPSYDSIHTYLISFLFTMQVHMELAEQGNVSTVLVTQPPHISLPRVFPSSTHFDPSSETNTFCI